jgi:hypothetical protein
VTGVLGSGPQGRTRNCSTRRGGTPYQSFPPQPDTCVAFDNSSEVIGTVRDLVINEEEKELYYLDVRAGGGFAGLGERIFLIPTYVVDGISADQSTLNKGREKVAGSSPFSTDRVPAPSYQCQIYDYYGYTGPPRTGAPRSRISGRREPWR